MKKELLKDIDKIRIQFELAKETNNVDKMIEIQSDYKEVYNALDRLNNEITNHIRDEHLFITTIKEIEEYNKLLVCLIPFIKKHKLHHIQIRNLERILTKNKEFSYNHLKNALNRNEEQFDELKNIILNNFKINKEITMTCNNCEAHLQFRNFFIPLNEKIGDNLKYHLFHEVAHKCMKCFIKSEDIVEKCPHGKCNSDETCEYNIYKDNQAVLNDFDFAETGHFKIYSKRR